MSAPESTAPLARHRILLAGRSARQVRLPPRSHPFTEERNMSRHGRGEQVAILTGGDGRERAGSLASARDVAEALCRLGRRHTVIGRRRTRLALAI